MGLWDCGIIVGLWDCGIMSLSCLTCRTCVEDVQNSAILSQVSIDVGHRSILGQVLVISGGGLLTRLLL